MGILEEINERQEQERKEETEAILKKINVPTKQKSRKRLLVKEAEDDMMKKYGVENKKTKVDNESTDGSEKNDVLFSCLEILILIQFVKLLTAQQSNDCT